jgi:hypothetical protein
MTSCADIAEPRLCYGVREVVLSSAVTLLTSVASVSTHEHSGEYVGMTQGQHGIHSHNHFHVAVRPTILNLLAQFALVMPKHELEENFHADQTDLVVVMRSKYALALSLSASFELQ